VNGKQQLYTRLEVRHEAGQAEIELDRSVLRKRLGRISRPRHSRWQIRERFWQIRRTLAPSERRADPQIQVSSQIRRTLAPFTSRKFRGFAKTNFCFGKSAGANDAGERFVESFALNGKQHKNTRLLWFGGYT